MHNKTNIKLYFRGTCTRKIFPIGNSTKTTSESTEIDNAIDANYYKGIDNHGQRTAIIQLNNPTYSNNRIYDSDGLSPALNCAEGGNRQPFILCDSGQGRKDQLRNENIAPLRANTGAGHNNIVCHSTLPRSSTSGEGGTGHLQRDDGVSYCCDANNNIAVEQPTVKRTPLKFMGRNQKNYDGGDYAFTIDSCNTGGVEVDKRIRRLLPIEAERLQGFPDNWTAEGINNDGDIVKIADTNRYKCLGNAVTVNVIEFIYKHIMEAVE